MRGLALCLAAGALLVAGCGSNDAGSAKAPAAQTVAASGGQATGDAGVSAHAPATPTALCAAEGRKAKKGKPPFGQCVSGLNRLKGGTAKNPRAACKGMSKKKTKGTRGKSPFAVCVTAAAKLMASNGGRTKGKGSPVSAPGSGSGSGSGSGDSTTTGDSGSGAGAADTTGTDLVCTDADGNEVSPDSPDVEDCTDSATSSDPNASDASSSSDETDTAGADQTDTSGDEAP